MVFMFQLMWCRIFALTAVVLILGKALLLHAHPLPSPLSLPKQAMPGGKVVVFTGLKQCVTTEEELAAVVRTCTDIFICTCIHPHGQHTRLES